MRHPAAFPNFSNPREVRSAMHMAYDRYLQGTDLLPKLRVTDPEGFGRKSQGIAWVLFREWGIIDEDSAYFDFVLTKSVEKMMALAEPTNGRIFAKLGRNAINFAVIKMPGDNQPGEIALGKQDTKSFLEQLDDDSLVLSDGRRPVYIDGDLQPEPQPDAVLYRRSGRSAVYVAKRASEEAAA